MLKVGELATATGLTVRALRYYEQIGLLPASGRSVGGHRLYAPADVQRLYRICLLRRPVSLSPTLVRPWTIPSGASGAPWQTPQ
jgi:DNA-binding transcriptional MerR regulator